MSALGRRALALLWLGMVVMGWVQAADYKVDIAYLRLTEDVWQVWITDRHGLQHEQVSYGDVDVTRVSWFPDGRRLLCNLSDGRLGVIEPGSREIRPLAMPASGMLDAVVSPDGRRIAFSMASPLNPDSTELWLVNVDGSGLAKVAGAPVAIKTPNWSPDGRSVLLAARNGAEDHQIWEIGLQEGRTSQLTAGGGDKMDPNLSRGGYLAYSELVAGQFDIHVRSPVGGKVLAVAPTEFVEMQPAWSSDGKWLAYSSMRDGHRRIWVWGREEGDLVPITPKDAVARAPAWRLAAGGAE